MNIGDKIPEVLGFDASGREVKASDIQRTTPLVAPLRLAASAPDMAHCAKPGMKLWE